MTTFKKIFAAATAAATIGVMSMTSLAVSAAPEPAEAPPYVVQMSVCAGAEQAWEAHVTELSDNGTYTSEYTFTQGSATIELLLFDSSINMYAFAPEEPADVAAETSVRMAVDEIKIVRADGSEAAITYNGPSDKAFRTGDNGSCMRLNILNTWVTTDKISDIDPTLPGEGVAAGDKIVVTWTLSGLTAPSTGGEGGETTTTTTSGDNGGTTTTTTTKKNTGSTGNSNNNSNNNKTTSTVSQTADAGVVAIVVGAAAAASLAAGAMTIKRKRK